jgi:hypothetical protein
LIYFYIIYFNFVKIILMNIKNISCSCNCICTCLHLQPIKVNGLERYMISINGKYIYDTLLKTQTKIYISNSKLKSNKGYCNCKLFNKNDNKYKFYTVHRLIGFTYLQNDDINTKTEVHHINHDRTNNDSKNLMWVSHQTNIENKGLYKNSTTGYTGVYMLSENKYRSMIRCKGKLIHLGIFNNILDAHTKYIEYKIKNTKYIKQI